MSLYPPPPGRRMAYHRDGTVGYLASSQFSASTMRALNTEGENGIGFTLCSGPITLFFPELRDVTAMFLASPNVNFQIGVYSIRWSANATSPSDGTWTTIASYATGNDPPWQSRAVSTYRDWYLPVTGATGVKALQFGFGSRNFSVCSDSGALRALHIYGDISAGQNPNRLRIWDPVLDQQIAPASGDWGDVQRVSAETRFFRVKNNSAIKTAIGCLVGEEVLTDKNPSMLSQYQFRYQGSAWATSVNIGDLAPGAISDLVEFRRTTPSTAILGLGAADVVATPSSFV